MWEGIEGEAAAVGPCVWGVDLGSTAAMSAVCAYWPDTGRLETLAAFPGVPSLEERGLADGVGRLYLDMQRRGELVQTGGRVVEVETLLREALSRFGPPDAVGRPTAGGKASSGTGWTWQVSRRRRSWCAGKAGRTARKTCGRFAGPV